MQERPHKHEVALSEEQRHALHQLISKGKAPARKLAHARVLLKIDRNAPGPRWTDEQVAEAFEMSRYTVIRIRERFATNGLDDALTHRPHTQTRARALDGEQEAHLIALSCSPSPQGQARWTLRLLANRMVELGYVEQVSYETVRRTLKKNELKPWLKECWCIPPHADAQFVWHMGDVLEVYTRPYDERFPQLCMDESGEQLISDKLEGLAMQPGQPERYDYSYEQGPMLNLFLACEPLAGKRMVKVTEQKTSKDWAHFMQEVIDVHYPNAEKIVLVMDNLATHSPAAFYHAFPPGEARRLAAKLEIHHTPLHGSWLNMAEIEFAALARQCLSRRIATGEELKHQVACWQEQRNAAATTVNWRFTTADAHIKLKRLYPSLKTNTTDSDQGTVANEV
jgi:transposase